MPPNPNPDPVPNPTPSPHLDPVPDPLPDPYPPPPPHPPVPEAENVGIEDPRHLPGEVEDPLVPSHPIPLD